MFWRWEKVFLGSGKVFSAPAARKVFLAHRKVFWHCEKVFLGAGESVIGAGPPEKCSDITI